MRDTIRTALGVAVSAVLLACGGGGGSGPGTGGTTAGAIPPQASSDAGSGGSSAPGADGTGAIPPQVGSENGDVTALSDNQALFEEMALAQNGGMFTIASTTGTSPFLQVNADHIELPTSPRGATGGVVGTYVSSALGSTVSAGYDTRDDRNGSAFVDNGRILFISSKTPSRYTYAGSDVLIEIAAPSGEVGLARRVTSHTKVLLTGKFSDAPQEFLNFYGNLVPTAKQGTVFLSGAAYYRQTAVRIGSQLYLTDGDGNVSTDPKSSTPVFAGTVEQFAAASPTVLNLLRGSFKTVNGVRCWVNNTAGATNPTTGLPSPWDVLTYQAYCEIGQKVYSGATSTDGAEIGSFYGSGANTYTRAPFVMRLNMAAVDSIRAMLP